MRSNVFNQLRRVLWNHGISFVNLIHSRITWEESLNVERLDQADPGACQWGVVWTTLQAPTALSSQS